MRAPNINHTERGFTLVEIIVAMAIFSMMLVIVTTGVLALFNIYEAGAQIRSTQKTARIASQSISGDLHVALGYKIDSPPHAATEYPRDTVCLFNIMSSGSTPIGSGSVYFVVQNGARYELHKKTFTGMPTGQCRTDDSAPAPPFLVFTGVERVLTDENVSLEVFDVKDASIGLDPTFLDIKLSVVPLGAKGDLVDLTPPALPKCKEGKVGSQYCSVTNLTIGGATHKEGSN